MKLSKSDRLIAVGKVAAGSSLREVAQHYNVNTKTIRRLMVKHRESGSVDDKPRSGRPKVTTERQDRYLVITALRNRKQTAKELNNSLQNTVPPGARRISCQTVRRRLHGVHLHARKMIKKPHLLRRHKQARLTWSQTHANWRIVNWNKVLFSDEVRICLKQIDGRRRVWRRTGEQHLEQCAEPKTAFGGGSIMLWAGISGQGKTDIVIINGNLNAQKYIDEILIPHVEPFSARIGAGFIFQQDNAKPHTARITKNHLQQQQFEVMNWPACSPDLNPIENLWDQLKRAVSKRILDNTTLNELPGIVVEEWQAIPMDRIHRLIRSMRQRCRECIASAGAYTHY